MPDLLDVQLRSFENLIARGEGIDNAWDFSLDRVFGEIFPITDVNERFTLEYVSVDLGEPKSTVEECIERDMTYACPLKAELRLTVWEDVEDGDRRPKDIIDKEVYLGDLPLFRADTRRVDQRQTLDVVVVHRRDLRRQPAAH